MKKFLKILLGVLIIIICWTIIFFIDYNNVKNLKMPIFVMKKYSETNLDTYYGLGYKIEAEKYLSESLDEHIIKINMYMFNKFIVGGVSEINRNTQEQNNSLNTNKYTQEYKSFRAIVSIAETQFIEVNPIEEEDKKILSDRVSIYLGEYNDIMYMKGQEVLITYTGFIRETYPTQIDAINIETEESYRENIEKLPQNYSLESAIKDNCVVKTNDLKIYNKNELDKFLENVEKNIFDFVRCVTFTKEGDMIITDVNFEGSNSFRVCYDTTRDKNISKENRKYKYGRLSKLTIENTNNEKNIWLKEKLEGEIKSICLFNYNNKYEIIKMSS